MLFPELSRQQNNVICILAEECLSAKEIADKMCIAQSTANNHIKEIKIRLGLNKNIELVREFFLRKIGSGLFILILVFKTFGVNGHEIIRHARRKSRRNEFEYIIEN